MPQPNSYAVVALRRRWASSASLTWGQGTGTVGGFLSLAFAVSTSVIMSLLRVVSGITRDDESYKSFLSQIGILNLIYKRHTSSSISAPWKCKICFDEHHDPNPQLTRVCEKQTDAGGFQDNQILGFVPTLINENLIPKTTSSCLKKH